MASTVQAAVTTVVTNYYRIDGNSVFELRQSLARNRPKGWKSFMDAHTQWGIEWEFTVAGRSQVYRIRSFDTTTKIVLTLPQWAPQTNLPPALVQQWTNYFEALVRHEAGHIKIALAAQAEIKKRASAVNPQPTQPALEDLVNQAAEQVVAEFRQKELEYDEKTQHGLTQGARFP